MKLISCSLHKLVSAILTLIFSEINWHEHDLSPQKPRFPACSDSSLREVNWQLLEAAHLCSSWKPQQQRCTLMSYSLYLNGIHSCGDSLKQWLQWENMLIQLLITHTCCCIMHSYSFFWHFIFCHEAISEIFVFLAIVVLFPLRFRTLYYNE